MRNVYIADDGTEFENRWECKKYEAINIYHPHLLEIEFLDLQGGKIEDPFNEHGYLECCYVIVTTEAQLADLNWYAKETGYDDFKYIDSAGSWSWESSKGKFIKLGGGING